MGISETLEKNKPVVFGVVGVVIAVAVVIMFFYLKGAPLPGTEPGNVYFYDVTTGDRFIAKEQLAPIAAPSRGTDPDGDPAGAKLVRYGCGSCDSPFDGHLEKYSAEAKAQLAPVFSAEHGFTWDQLSPAIKLGLVDARANGRFVAAVATPVVWVKANSREGAAIFSEIASKCAGNRPVECDASH